ncbi:Hpt domain-containing protein, partial [Salmonella enterica]|uniref:Hpt domain-containing protein n=1 Tax=Salmonella enterica TaxID=28901 RepID=UPI003FA6ECE6
MGDTSAASANQSAGIDLSQFYQVFFEEAGENLDRMEQQLLAIDVAAADDEELNAIFRCAHSIKGGAATFG